jgi:hypothetical protein
VGKHTDALGTLDSFKAPWESETGQDAELDPVKLKKYLFNLQLDKAKAQDARDEADEKVTAAEKNLKDAKAEVAKGDPTGKIAELEAELDKAKAVATDAGSKVDRLEVALDKGLSARQAARLVGSTKEELEADAAEFAKELGITTTQDSEDLVKDGDEDEDGNVVDLRRSARPVVTPGDPKPGTDGEVDYDKLASGIVERRRF